MAYHNIIGKANGKEAVLYLPSTNRHGIITGGTGSGKSITLQRLIEIFSNSGVSVIIPDVKGDLTGFGLPAVFSDGLKSILQSRDITPPKPKPLPVEYWSAGDEIGLPLQCTLQDFGIGLLSSVLALNNNQSQVLQSLFRIAENEGIAINTCDDLLQFIAHIYDDAKEYRKEHGSISLMSLDVIIRSVKSLQDLGIDSFFSDTTTNIESFIRQDDNGQGFVNVLQSVNLIKTPRVYACVVLWLLKELYDKMPEVGNLPAPKIAFFFDEAHLLFNLKSKPLIDTIENTVRLIRSKGVGVYLITQAPSDIPDEILQQLNNRIQHRLSSNTPKSERALVNAAKTMIPNPSFCNVESLRSLEVGEALVSCLNDKGRPYMTEKVYVIPPSCYTSKAPDDFILETVHNSELYNETENTNNCNDNSVNVTHGNNVTFDLLKRLGYIIVNGVNYSLVRMFNSISPKGFFIFILLLYFWIRGKNV